MKKASNFSNTESSVSVCYLAFVFFCQFKPDVAYKSVAYAKTRVTILYWASADFFFFLIKSTM